jgi:predicted adenylyl cyclase CyaB
MRNVEAKFPVRNLAAARQRAEAIGFEYIGTLLQRDTFFMVPNGKLKLREQPDGAWLIGYQRHRDEGLELSDYEIVTVSEPVRLRALLSAALGVLAEVRKRRLLLQRANIRLHLDEVAGYGTFGELEAIIDVSSDPVGARSEIAAILGELRVPAEQLIGVSYFELTR